MNKSKNLFVSEEDVISVVQCEVVEPPLSPVETNPSLGVDGEGKCCFLECFSGLYDFCFKSNPDDSDSLVSTSGETLNAGEDARSFEKKRTSQEEFEEFEMITFKDGSGDGAKSERPGSPVPGPSHAYTPSWKRRQTEPNVFLASRKHSLLFKPRRFSSIPKIRVISPSGSEEEAEASELEEFGRNFGFLSPNQTKIVQMERSPPPRPKPWKSLPKQGDAPQRLNNSPILDCAYGSLATDNSILIFEFRRSTELIGTLVALTETETEDQSGSDVSLLEKCDPPVDSPKQLNFKEKLLLMTKDPGGRTGDTYTCITHENLKLMIMAIIPQFPSEGNMLDQLVDSVVCYRGSPLCMFGLCEKCPYIENVRYWAKFDGYEDIEDEDVEYYNWEEEEDGKRVLKLMKQPQQSFSKCFNTFFVHNFLRHCFINEEQRRYLEYLRMEVDESFAIISMDFCKPYATIFNGSAPKTSRKLMISSGAKIAIHPFLVEYFNEEENMIQGQYFVVISNDLRECPLSSFLFRREMMKWLKPNLPRVRRLVYFTDDNPGHFKNPEMILNLLFHEQDFKLKASHEFTVDGHATEECSLEVERIKKFCHKACLNGEADIQTALDMYIYCNRKLRRWDLQFGYVDGNTDQCVIAEEKLETRFRLNEGVIPGLKHFNSYQPMYDVDGGWNDYVRVKRFALSEFERIMKVRVTLKRIGSQCDEKPPFLIQYDPEMERMGKYCGFNQGQLKTNNLIVIELENAIYKGKITDDSGVVNGDLGVTLDGRLETKTKSKSGKPVYTDLQVETWVSTLDVLKIEDAVVAQGKIKKDKCLPSISCNRQENRPSKQARSTFMAAIRSLMKRGGSQ